MQFKTQITESGERVSHIAASDGLTVRVEMWRGHVVTAEYAVQSGYRRVAVQETVEATKRAVVADAIRTLEASLARLTDLRDRL